ncbi:MAG: helix-turn-helix domain-containing protein [Meiothermus sp.]|nr:helix-turn-helix domain-containing protein [Meiothermus sp.]
MTEERTHPSPQQLALFHSMAVLQERWVLFILWQLLEADGPMGFNELTRRAPVNATTLATRLDLLEREGMVSRTVHSTIPPKTSYALTEKGQALGPVFQAIRRWAEAFPPSPDHPPDCGTEELGKGKL